MACPLRGSRRTPAINTQFLCHHFRKTGADYLFTVCHCHLSRRILFDSFFKIRNNEICYQNFSVCYCCKQIARIFIESSSTFYIFFDNDAAVFTSTCCNFFQWRRKGLDFDDESMFSPRCHTLLRREGHRSFTLTPPYQFNVHVVLLTRMQPSRLSATSSWMSIKDDYMYNTILHCNNSLQWNVWFFNNISALALFLKHSDFTVCINRWYRF